MRRLDRRTWLWLLAGVTLVIGAVLLAIEGRMWDEGGPGIVGFELAGSVERASEIRMEWGPDGRAAARLSLGLDFAYLVAYGAFWMLAAAATRDLAARRGWRRLGRLGRPAIALAVAAPVLDALENTALLVTLAGKGGGLAPGLAAAFAVGKFVALAGCIGYVVAGLLARLTRRRLLAGSAAVALALIGLLAVNTYLVDRATEPAESRTISLPGGDIHVEEDGARDAPPLLLIHGFASSTRWWDRVVRPLARRHRVIRVDLLGHGASEAPREGYSMESQADLVAGVMDRLGVRRAAVVGHSMGGLVATALIERHPARVSRLLTIGTPNDLEHAGGTLGQRLTFVPVLGHALDTLVPRRMVRAELERAFPPEVDVPERLVDDVEGMTYSAYRESGLESADYRRRRTVAERLARAGVPLTVAIGSRDSRVEPVTADAFRGLPRAKVLLLEGAGHSPQVEDPPRATRLILRFLR
jgi:pimeloyl-ACP methyl ester carboxylesterase